VVSILSFVFLWGCSVGREAPPGQMGQFPSPMVEHIRAHQRIENKEVPGVSIVLKDTLSKPVEIYFADRGDESAPMDLLMHFHGAGYVPKHAVYRSRHPVLKWGPVGMQLLTETRAGGLTILGFAGNSAPDHVDHFHGLPIFLKTLLDK